MSKKFTPEALFRNKLTNTPVPDWREGWDRMQPALDAMAGSPAYSKKRFWLKRLSAAAAVTLLAGLAAWRLWTAPTVKPVQQAARAVIRLPEAMNTAKPREEVPEDSAAAIQQPSIVLTAYKTAIADNALQDTPDIRQEAIPVLPARHPKNRLPVLSGMAAMTQARMLPLAFPPAGSFPGKETAQEQFPRGAFTENLKPEAGPPGMKKHAKTHFAIRLNANGSSSFGNAAANFNPVMKGMPVDIYPSVSVGRQISPKLSVQAGLAIASPVNVQHDGLNRSVSNPLRALAANVPQSQDSINLSRLYYADIPLTLQYHLNPRFSIGSGIQVSVLEKVIGKKQRIDYDNYGLVAMADPREPRPENLTNAKPASGTINPVDLRWVIGLRYQLGRHWNASLQYQYGLTDISSNKAFLNDHINRNNVLRAGIGFLIR